MPRFYLDYIRMCHAQMRLLQEALDQGAGPGRMSLIWTSHTDPEVFARDPATDLSPYIHWWAPNGKAANPAYLAEMVARGDTVWFYHSGHPSVGLHIVNATGVEMLTWPMIDWRYGLSGSFWWAVNYWDRADPLRVALFKEGEDRWGNGILFYPGKALHTIGFPDIEGPLARGRHGTGSPRRGTLSALTWPLRSREGLWEDHVTGRVEGTRQAEAASSLLEHVSRTLGVLAPCSAAVLVSREGRLLLERYLRGPEPHNPAQAVDERSLWPWWSMTKSAAAALIARPVTEGRCALDQKLSTVLPEFGEKGPGPFDRRSVTVRHVMSHTSGCEIDGREEDGTMVDARVDLSAIGIVSEPGTTFVYSALGMHVLERFVEALLSEDFESLLKREVLAPFGMSDVRYIYQDDFAADPSLCARAMPSEEGRVAFSQRNQRAGTGLYSSARDILTFGERWASLTDASGARWCSPAVREEVWRKHTLRPSDGADYGLLWWVFDDLAGYVASGASCGLCALLPGEGIVAVVARNHFGSVRAPYDYNADKRKILELARAFSA